MRKNRPSVTITARKSRDPMTVLAIALIGTPVEDATDAAGADDSASGLELSGAGVDGDGDGRVAVVEDGINVDDRAFSFRHDLSSLAPTLMMSETPPNPPCASLIMNNAFVPAGMAAGQPNWRFPRGTGIDVTFPPGITTEMVTGCTALPYPSKVKGLAHVRHTQK